tara:strand:- start:7409 stop:8230 length:822 start_codon:yes stop_codon:yes gene_type:complete
VNSPDLISHYTSLDGFRAIVQSRKIWATNVMFLNDNKEYFHAFEVFDKEFENFKEEIKPSSNDDIFFLSAFRQCMDEMDYIGSEQHYVTSFSENIDQLSQWRAYGSVGIIFNKKLLEECLSRYDAVFSSIAQCKYDSRSLEQEFRNRIRELYANYQSTLKSKGKEEIFNLIIDFQVYIFDIAAFYKDGGFHEECEVRLSCTSTGDETVEFRSDGSYLIPYIEVPYDLDTIDSVIIGPCVDPDKTEKSIELFLKKQFSENLPKIYKSKSPFRNW